MNATERFNDAKFGMFVHWGAYCVDGVEASWPVMLGPELQRRFIETLHRLGAEEVEMPAVEVDLPTYEAFPERFDPKSFDADEWADLARDAGQRYMVFTTKHHDGFAMFDTSTTDYSITKGPFGRDVTAELAAACGRAGIGFGTYFSAPDFHDDGYRDRSLPLPSNFLGQPERPEWPAFLDRMETQVRELCSNYGELCEFWWDIGFGPQWPVDRFHSIVRELQPNAAINDRLGGLAPGIDAALAADFLTPEQSVPKAIPRRSTLGVPLDPTMIFALIQRDDWSDAVDQIAPLLRAHFDAPADPTVPDTADFQPWEACMTFGGAWAWAPSLTGDDLKTGTDIINNLVQIASRGGNLLMNVGPRPDGTIQSEFQTALREVGAWLSANGEAIHGSTFGPVQGRSDYVTTRRDDNVYVHVSERPEGGVVELPCAAQPSGARLLADGTALEVAWDGTSATVELGRIEVAATPTVIALDGAAPQAR